MSKGRDIVKRVGICVHDCICRPGSAYTCMQACLHACERTSHHIVHGSRGILFCKKKKKKKKVQGMLVESIALIVYICTIHVCT